MGYIADNVERTRQVLGVRSFQEWFDPVLSPLDDLPYLPPRYQSMLERSTQVVEHMRARAEAAHEAGFVSRTQSGHFAWAGPPGHQENRVQRAPEQSGGNVLSRIA